LITEDDQDYEQDISRFMHRFKIKVSSSHDEKAIIEDIVNEVI